MNIAEIQSASVMASHHKEANHLGCIQFEHFANGEKVIQYGKDSKNVPVITGMMRSFGDAPGGFNEELKEYNIATGLEYWYDKQFAVRVGYFNEANTKGGRKYATFGIGLRYQVFGIDAAYLQPFTQRHPLQNTIRFSLLFDIDAFKKQVESK